MNVNALWDTMKRTNLQIMGIYRGHILPQWRCKVISQTLRKRCPSKYKKPTELDETGLEKKLPVTHYSESIKNQEWGGEMAPQLRALAALSKRP